MSSGKRKMSATFWACALAAAALVFGVWRSTEAQVTGPLPDILRDMPQDMKENPGMYDNLLTAIYEQWLAGWLPGGAGGTGTGANSPGPDVRMSNPEFAGRQNEFQIDINPSDTRFAIGTSNDGRLAGVGIYRTDDGGLTWTAQDAPIGQAACCDPAVAYGTDGVVYVGVLDTSPRGQHTLRSTDNGETWTLMTFAPLQDRNNLAVDPRDSNIVYPWIDVAGDGTIWVGWNDRREDPNNFRSRWYQAFSTDEGATWTEEAVGDEETQPSTFIGDYHGLAAENDRVLGMWYDSRDNASGDPYTDPILSRRPRSR